MNSGEMVLFNATKTSAAGYLGFGKLTIPERVIIKRSNGAVNKAVWQ